MCNIRLDARERFPSGMEDYLGFNGWHFNRKMYEWAVSMMVDRNGKKVTPMKKDELENLMGRYGINLEHAKGYDAVYVASMAKADFWGSSISDEQHLAMYVYDVIEDKDGYEGMPFTRFYADMIGAGIPIEWEDML